MKQLTCWKEQQERWIIIVGAGKVGTAFLPLLVHDIWIILWWIVESKEPELSSLESLIGLKTREVEELIITLQDHPYDEDIILQEKINSKVGSKYFNNKNNHKFNPKPRWTQKKSFQFRKK